MTKVANFLNASLRLNKLDQFLQSKGTFSVVELHGLLTAIISAPEMILPSKWIPLSKIQDLEFANTN